MENTIQRKQVFANLQDLLASLPERERLEFRKYLDKHEIIGNQTLEPIILFQYNTALFVDSAIDRLNSSIADAEARMAVQKAMLESFLADFLSAIETKKNQVIAELSSNLETTVRTSNEQISKLNTGVANFADNLWSFTDATVDKMLDQIANEQTKKMNEFSAFMDLAKIQIPAEIQALIIEAEKARQEQLNNELRVSVKQPIADHLKKYLEIVKKRTSVLDELGKPWSPKNLIREFIVTGGAILILKLLHFI